MANQYRRMKSDLKIYFLKMMVRAKNCDISNFSLFGGKLWFPGQK
jgi:hypothetical protein